MTLLEAIQHDLNNRPTRKSISSMVYLLAYVGADGRPSVTLAELEAAYERVSFVMDTE